MSLRVAHGHLVNVEQYNAWNDYDSDELVALCGWDANDQWRKNGQGLDTKAFEAGYPEWELCPDCKEHPDYALILLGNI